MSISRQSPGSKPADPVDTDPLPGIEEGFICDLCFDVLNGTPVLNKRFSIRHPDTDRLHKNEVWALRRQGKPTMGNKVKAATLWKALHLHSSVERVVGLNQAPQKMPTDRGFSVMLHHHYDGLMRSAMDGCLSCQQFLKQIKHMETTPEGRMPSFRECVLENSNPSIPILERVEDEPSFPHKSPGALRLTLLFFLWAYIDGAQTPVQVSVSMIGPVGEPDTKWTRGLQKPTLLRLKDWMGECESQTWPGHLSCRKRAALVATNFKGWPTRLLQILGPSKQFRSIYPNIPCHSDTLMVRLRERIRGAEEALGPQYTTLSHCWGNRDFATKLTSENYEKLLAGIPVADLSLTFSDAIAVTLSLGLEYIWIDALCIIQDSEEDWTEEAPRMANVYSNAKLNIAANLSGNSRGGLFHDILRTPDHTQANWGTPFIPSGRYRMMPYHQAEALELEYPLTSRAWCLQERLLAKRSVDFSRDRVQWRCHTVEDDDCHTPSRAISGGHLICDQAMIEGQWTMLVTEFSLRKLTVPSDRLVAFSAIAESFAFLHFMKPSDYVAGLWRPNFRDHLNWFVNRDEIAQMPPSETMEQQYWAPSWSWASIRTFADLRFSNCRWDWHPDFDVINVVSETKAANPYGPVVSAHADLQVRIVEIVIGLHRRKTSAHSRGLYVTSLNRMSCAGGATYYPDDLGDCANKADVAGYFLPTTINDDRSRVAAQGLMIVPVDESKVTFKRIGFLREECIRSRSKLRSLWSPGQKKSQLSVYINGEEATRNIRLI